MGHDGVLERAMVHTQVFEATRNYGLADEPFQDATTRVREGPVRMYYDDANFWRSKLTEAAGWGSLYLIRDAYLSEWIPRVPGMFWKPESETLRRLSPANIERESPSHITFNPPGKSRKVVGGIGTLRLPPSEDGYRLLSLTTTLNASAGVPVLVSSDVWVSLGLRNGDLLRSGEHPVMWQAMAKRWLTDFPAIRGLPRGYLLLDDSAQLEVVDRGAPVQFHPFTVMEYQSRETTLFDYVYATADSADPFYRGYLEHFFEEYRMGQDRYGEYLLAADMAEPLWDARYESPRDLRAADRAADARLRLMEARVRESVEGGETLEQLLQGLSGNCSLESLGRLSAEAGVRPAVWSGSGSIADEASKLVNQVVKEDRVGALLQAYALHVKGGYN